jgi:hypothetical protein
MLQNEDFYLSPFIYRDLQLFRLTYSLLSMPEPQRLRSHLPICRFRLRTHACWRAPVLTFLPHLYAMIRCIIPRPRHPISARVSCSSRQNASNPTTQIQQRKLLIHPVNQPFVTFGEYVGEL